MVEIGTSMAFGVIALLSLFTLFILVFHTHILLFKTSPFSINLLYTFLFICGFCVLSYFVGNHIRDLL